MNLRTITQRLVAFLQARALHVAAAPVLICLAAGVGEGAVVTQDSNGFVTSITGLDFSGTSYDVTFTYNTSFDGLYGAGDPPSTLVPTFYNDAAGAAAAQNAIESAVSAITTAPGGGTLVVPSINSGNPTNRYDAYYVQHTPPGWTAGFFAPLRIQSISNTGYATFSPAAVPEPSTLTLLGLAGAGGLLALRRRRRAT